MFESINIIGEKTASKIFADVGDNLKSLTTFIEQHGDQIADILSKVTQLVLGFTRALLEMATSDKVKGFLDGLLSMFGHVDTATGKWVADTDKIQTALEALATFVATIFVAKITGGIRDVLKELKPLLALLAPFAGILGLPALGTAVVGGALIGGSDPSKGLTHGGRPDGTLNPGDELPGAGGGSSSEGEGAWARAKRLGRAALGAIGLGGGKSGAPMPSIPDTVPMTPQERNTLGLIMKYESHGQNTMNYVGKSQGLDPQTPKGYTAQGYFQMLNSNWRRIAPQLGITAPNAMAGTLEEQTRVALHLLRNGGIQNWSNFNPSLRAALARGEKAPVGSVPNVAPNSPPAAATAPVAPPVAMPNAQGAVEKFNDTMKRLDTGKLREFGAATQGFDPSQYFNAPPAGATSTSNDNSVRKQSYRGGDTHVTINTHGDARETADMWRRHGERQKADDVRYAASVFA